MTTKGPLTVQQVRKLTGLTARALRFYESRGLVAPARTFSGARLYGAAELEQLHKVLVLRRAGLTLEQIGTALAGRGPALVEMVSAQLDALKEQAAQLGDAIASLEAARGYLQAGGTADVDTLCHIIRNGGTTMASDDWKKVLDRFYTPEEQAHWAERKAAAMPKDFDQEAYQRQWQELAARIEAALPLDPASGPAQAFYDEWQKLLAPFTAVATPQMMEGAAKVWSGMDQWAGQEGMPQAPFSMKVWEFVRAAGQARKDRESA